MLHRSAYARSSWQRLFTTLRGVVLSLLCAASLFGQATGRITGSVVDPSGGMVPGVTVLCKNADTGLARSADTNQSGIFEFPDLPIGNYQLEVSKQGFQKLLTDRMQLVTGQVLDMKLALRVGDLTQTVSVSGEAPLVESASSTVQTTVTQSLMQDLP